MKLRRVAYMDFDMKVLGPQNEAEIEAFERRKLAELPGDEFEKEMSTWKARWRKEALEHYLRQGWSFGVWSEKGELLGYSLGQPLLFVQGFTQALWVEHLSANNDVVFDKLIEISYRWSRDKHLQRVLFSSEGLSPEAVRRSALQPVSEALFELKTAKY